MSLAGIESFNQSPRLSRPCGAKVAHITIPSLVLEQFCTLIGSHDYMVAFPILRTRWRSEGCSGAFALPIKDHLSLLNYTFRLSHHIG